MHRPRSAPASAVVAIVAVVVMGLVLIGRPGTERSSDPPGQLWRRGFLGGEQFRLLENGRYQRQSWSRFGEETLESGTWSPLAEIVSLVPATPGDAPRVMRKVRLDETWFLYEPTPAGGQPARDAMYERVD
jgi:hypothetical protein